MEDEANEDEGETDKKFDIRLDVGYVAYKQEDGTDENQCHSSVVFHEVCSSVLFHAVCSSVLSHAVCSSVLVYSVHSSSGVMSL